MIKGETSSGFHYELNEQRLNNYELLEYITEMEENPLVLSNVVRMLLGDEQTKKLKNHLRTEDGFVPADKMTEEITCIFQNQSETKNF